jgi:hypothetical protein
MIEKTIPIDRIESESNREHGGDGDIKILAEDMKRNGLINPITIKAALAEGAEDPGKKLAILYRVTAGRRRLAAALKILIADRRSGAKKRGKAAGRKK